MPSCDSGWHLYFCSKMNYTETLDYLYTKLPMFSRIGAAAIKPDLTNTLAVCSFLNDPHKKIKTIHVAGTNGKGSVSHMLAAILQTAGYKTGLYTSPHLKDFRERIKINGEMISEEAVVSFTEKIKSQIEKTEPSFFEITVAMAFDHFANEKVDIAVIETGLGGRLDSTNIITPEISVITNIGWDHMNLLGDTLDKIAFEKAGIIKENVPVIIGEWLSETKPVFENTAQQKNAPIIFASEKRQATDWKWARHELIVEVAEQHHTDRQVYHLDLQGIYQTKNLLSVLEACTQLQQKGWNISGQQIKHALQHVKQLTGLHGRWEIIHHNPDIVLDVAHNTDGMHQLLQQVELAASENLHIITGMVKDKEVDKVLSMFPKHATYYFTQAHIPRALPANELQQKAMQYELKGDVFENVNDAIAKALQHAHEKDMILVCGSVFLVGEVS